MRYFWYGFLGLFSLGFLGLIVAAGILAYVFNYYGQDLPDYSQLKDYKPPIVSRLYAGDGRLMAEFAQEKRVFMPIDTIPNRVKNAFISAEDQNFYTHEGVDLTAILRAAIIYARHKLGQNVSIIGGSTITQQVVKNFLLTNERSFERKIKEAILSYRMEKVLDKDRILELYLNEIYMGARSYGIAAAALQYFNKSLEELSIAEAAYLASLPKAPNNYHPVRNHDAALARRNWVISRMQEDGYITQEEEELAKLEPLKTTPRDDSDTVEAPYFTEEVRRILSAKYGEESLYGGGLAVRSTINPKLQDIAVNALHDGLMAYDKRHGWRGPVKHFDTITGWRDKLEELTPPRGKLDHWKMGVVLSVKSSAATVGFLDSAEGTVPLANLKWARESRNEGYALGPEITAATQVLNTGDVILVEPDEDKKNTYILRQIPLIQGAIIAMDPHTGRVLAMQGGWNHRSSVFNRATQAKRQPGSAFKPFVYIAALEKGFTPATLVLDAPFTIEDRPGHWWSPTNYSNKYYGPTPIRVGVEKSKNLMTVRLANYIGMDTIAEHAEKYGITDNMPHHLANSLGAGETTLLRLTSAYAVFVNSGKKIVPSFIDRIQDRRGKTIFRHDDRTCRNCGSMLRWVEQEAPTPPNTNEQIADPRNAYQMVSILEGVVQRGTGVRIKSLDRPLAGKTGTTNESKDTWFIGFSPDLVVGVFAGFDDPPRSLGKRETGSSVAVPIFKDFMEEALEDEPVLPFRVPPGIRHVRINAETGARAGPTDEKTIWEAFLTGTEPSENVYILNEYGINVMNSYQDPMYQTDGFSGAYYSRDNLDGVRDYNTDYNNTDGWQQRPSSSPFQPPYGTVPSSRYPYRNDGNGPAANTNENQQPQPSRPDNGGERPSNNNGANWGTGGLY